MRGLPSGRSATSAGFMKSNTLGSRFSGVPLGARTSTNPGRREGGIKVSKILLEYW